MDLSGVTTLSIMAGVRLDRRIMAETVQLFYSLR